MRALKHPNPTRGSLLEEPKDFKEQHVCTVLAEVESNLRFMCLAMDAARFNVFASGDEPLETALGLLEAFYLFVDGQADTLRGVLQELPLFTLDELGELAKRRTAEQAAAREPGAAPQRRKPGINAGELLRGVRPVKGFGKAFGEAVAPENAG